MALEAKDKTIYDLLNDKQFIIPNNQRKYVWDQNNWQELLDDIKLVIEERMPNHFIGSVVLKEETIKDGIKNHFTIIDGQQRIITITVIFAVLSYLYAELNDKEHFLGVKKSLFVTDNKGVEHTMVSTTANKDIDKLISDIYSNLYKNIEQNIPVQSCNDYLTSLKINKSIKECFVFFHDNFKTLVNNDISKIENIQDILNDVRYIDVIAKEDEDAYTVFEILNARGKPLSDFELLRNFLIKYSSREGKPDIISELQSLETLLGDNIEIFLKHYVTHKYGKKADKNNNRPYKIIVNNEKNKSKNDLLNDLILKSKYYDRIINYTDCSDLEKKIFSFFKPRRQQQFRPLVLGLMHQKDLGGLTQEKYEESLNYLYSFFLCYNVIGDQNSNKIEDVVYKYSNRLENSFDDTVIKDMKKSMYERIPGIEAFRDTIKNIRFSHVKKAYSGTTKSENVRAIFEVIEREHGYTGELNHEKFNIEHCYPDSVDDQSEKNVLIGNLMLLETDLNDKCKNKDLSLKIEFYKKSSLNAPHILLSSMKNNSFDIYERTNQIADELHSYIMNLSECNN